MELRPLANELTSIGGVLREGQVFLYHHKGCWPNEWSLIIILATKVFFFLIKGQEIKLLDWLWWGKGSGALRAEKGPGRAGGRVD